ncbi:MAG TPA: DUF4192 family protein, partial [Actinomycetaceae bacterium]|nr:DUF4192 family protein [Actinomycetaceae bacterium]
MTTPPAIRVNDPAELLALIAYQLGFIPARSMVFLGIRGDGTAGMAARVDLSAVATPDAGDDLVDEIAAHLVADDAQQVLIVVYSETSHDHLADHPYVTGLLPTVARRLPWPDATWWHVGPTSFTRLDPERGPGRPRRLSDLEATQVAAAMVVAGRRIVATREELAALPRVDAEARSAARGAAERARAIRDARSTTGIEAWRSGQSQRWRRLLTAGREGTGLTPEELGRMGVALGDIDVRDQIISAAVQG